MARKAKVELTRGQKAAQTRKLNREIAAEKEAERLQRLKDKRFAKYTERKLAREAAENEFEPQSRAQLEKMMQQEKQLRHAQMYNASKAALQKAIANPPIMAHLYASQFAPSILMNKNIELDRDTAETFENVALSRNIDVKALLRVLARSLTISVRHYELATVIDFGKYNGETMANVCKVDPSYATWMINNIDRLTFSDAVTELLDTITGASGDKQ